MAPGRRLEQLDRLPRAPPNADYAQDSFAIFSAAPGTVIVDDIGGNVLASGMQFASDGYVVTGDALTLTGTNAIMQVGDGSVAGVGYTATIDAALAGTAGLVKTDAGTLILSGANSYSGGTAINGGTVRISSDANLGDAAGGLSFNGGTLNTTTDLNSARAVDLAGAGTFLTDGATTLTLGGTVSGAGALTKDGTGSLVLTADNGYTGGTTIAAGTLQLGNGGTSGSIVGRCRQQRRAGVQSLGQPDLCGRDHGQRRAQPDRHRHHHPHRRHSYTGGTTISAGTLQLGDGGTTGGITGDVVNNAALAFDRSDGVTFAGLISGTGTLTQAGSGTTVLTGANSYAGATSVSAGTLLINGDQSAATGATSVSSGATLGGTGTIGGDVTLADGATLAPGSGGAGALTINGGLALSGGSLLAYDFGLANAPGSPLNDVVNVGGNLTLDGTINVAVTPGGAFDIGLYRIANYGGTLTDNGLAIGAMPAGADVFVQTAVANQVNLINTGSAVLNFWDGAAGPKFNGVVNGGDGVWQNGTGNDNWADATGTVNAPFDDGAFAIFTGAAGTVTIDNGLGAVTASGLQFAANGYTITGGDLALTGPQSVIRVGDGTAAGAGYTATVNSAITGATQLVKTDAGTLVLSGANSYTGGTAINGGTVRIASDASLGAAAGGLSLNGGTLNTTADLSSARAVDLAGAGTFLTDAGTTLTLSGAVSGAGGLTKSGAGTLVLAGTGSHAGVTNVGAGTLLVNGNYAAATGATSVASGAQPRRHRHDRRRRDARQRRDADPGRGRRGHAHHRRRPLARRRHDARLGVRRGQHHWWRAQRPRQRRRRPHARRHDQCDRARRRRVRCRRLPRVQLWRRAHQQRAHVSARCLRAATSTCRPRSPGQVNLVNSRRPHPQLLGRRGRAEEQRRDQWRHRHLAEQHRQRQLDRYQRRRERRLFRRRLRHLRRHRRHGDGRQRPRPGHRGRHAVRGQRLYAHRRRHCADGSAVDHPGRRRQHGGRRVHRHDQCGALG